jgi:superfamily II DNA or RNA helicase
LVAPTGTGKTTIAAKHIEQEENKHVLWLTHRRELVFQPRDRLTEFGIEAGVILAGEPLNQMARVQIASIQTLWSRCIRGSTDLPHANLIFVDEAHHVRARTYRHIIESYPEARVVGMTATPCRRDGRGLGSTFDVMVETPQIEQMIEMGYLVKTRVWAPSTPDLTGVHTRKGDYVEAELAERVDRPELVGDIVTHWHRLGDGRQTIVFATSVAHSIHLCEEFVKSDVKAAHIDGFTPKDERDEILRQLAAGDVKVVVNCQVLTEGFDCPDVGTIVLARPTRSMGLYRQMLGRGLRPAPGKCDCLVLDHAGATFAHGHIEEPVVWTLREDRKAFTKPKERNGECAERRLLACTECGAVRTGGKPCPECGHMPRRHGEHLEVIDGDLEHLERGGARRPYQYSHQEQRAFYLGLLHLALARGNKPGAAAHRFKEKFNRWPDRLWQHLPPVAPSGEVLAWDRHCRIRYAKAMEKAAACG